MSMFSRSHDLPYLNLLQYILPWLLYPYNITLCRLCLYIMRNHIISFVKNERIPVFKCHYFLEVMVCHPSIFQSIRHNTYNKRTKKDWLYLMCICNNIDFYEKVQNLHFSSVIIFQNSCTTMTDFLAVNAHKPQVPVAKDRLSISHPEPEIKALCTNCTIYLAGG